MDFITKIKRNNYVKKTIDFLEKFTFPGLEGLSIYYVVRFFIQRANHVSIDVRASSLAFKFFMAIFPSLIFLFTLIPYLPIHNFQEELFIILKQLLPHEVFDAAKDTILDLITNKQGGLLSFGFIFTFYLTTNGIKAMIESFNDTSHLKEKRSSIKIWLVSIAMVFLLFLLLAAGIALIVFGEIAIQYLLDRKILTNGFSLYSLQAGKWLVMLAMFFFSISTLYFFGPAKTSRYKFFSAGASLATAFIVLVSLGFAFYVNNFANYNKLYGSLGTIIVIMLWIYFITLGILLGYELNNTIATGSIEKRKVQSEKKSIR
jgi:membrane protein